ncbi:hypothetical protein [Qipengyuania atrilutea]|uniref:Adenylate cyclase n=1 Tax=Qipengyuania atrilutea TaxID=2744473 RepID=A0A850H1T9_9SPHN|nr:hypothetical protein [Actirhodobacter atriluteus]NVD45931.1 hypothetical protein [Actirhodobacter atriluteus]
MADEIAEILCSPIFVRAPRQAELLRYLGERAQGSTTRITQYDIAVEALGKDETFDESSDSYVRSSMSRLRKSLKSYYSEHLPKRDLCVFNKPGEYFLRMAELHTAYPEFVGGHPSALKAAHSTEHHRWLEHADTQTAMTSVAKKRAALPQHSLQQPCATVSLGAEIAEDKSAIPRFRMFVRSGVLLSVILLSGILVTILQSSEKITASSGIGQSLPSVGFAVMTLGSDEFKESHSGLQGAVRNDLTQIIASSFISQRAASAAATSDYKIEVVLQRSLGEEDEASLMLTNQAGKILYERRIILTGNHSQDRQLIYDNIVGFVSPAGQLSKDLARRIPPRSRNDFECFVLSENSNAKGLLTADVVRTCLSEYPDSPYYPYFLARKIWMNIQKRATDGMAVEVDSSIWREVGQAVNDYPENPYLNFLAAKVLTARGECDVAKPFADRALENAKSFPALELALIIETYGCDSNDALEPQRANRIQQLVHAHPLPDDLFKLYMFLALITAEQSPSAELMALDSFDHRSASNFEEVNSLLANTFSRPLNKSEHQRLRRSLPAFVFSKRVRDLVLNRARGGHEFQSSLRIISDV